MIASAKRHPATSATYHYPEMMALIANGRPSSRAALASAAERRYR
jgi:hypothetical protein